MKFTVTIMRDEDGMVDCDVLCDERASGGESAIQ